MSPVYSTISRRLTARRALRPFLLTSLTAGPGARIGPGARVGLEQVGCGDAVVDPARGTYSDAECGGRHVYEIPRSDGRGDRAGESLGRGASMKRRDFISSLTAVAGLAAVRVPMIDGPPAPLARPFDLDPGRLPPGPSLTAAD